MPDTRKREGGLVQSIPPLPEVEDARLSFKEQMRAIRELFGLPEELSVGEMALGFGVGSIGRVPPRIFGPDSFTKSKVPVKRIEGSEIGEQVNQLDVLQKNVAKTGQENVQFEQFKQFGPENVQLNVGGVKPPTSALEAKALLASATKLIQTRVKEVQKDLDRLAIAEANPLAPQSLIQEIAKKGLRSKASHEPTNNQIVISFKSKAAKLGVDDEFAILPTPDGPVLAVNFNSPTIKSELRPAFKRAFPKKFLADEIGAEFQPGELQRMAGETAKDAPPPDNFSYYNLKNFEDGLQVINKMLDIATPETIVGPAIRYKGKVFPGKIGELHVDVYNRALKSGDIPELNIIEIIDTDLSGFVTSTGRYVDRVEAGNIARKTKQVKDLRALEGPELDASDFPQFQDDVVFPIKKNKPIPPKDIK